MFVCFASFCKREQHESFADLHTELSSEQETAQAKPLKWQMTKSTVAGKGQARGDDVTSNQMIGKMGTRQTSIRCNKRHKTSARAAKRQVI